MVCKWLRQWLLREWMSVTENRDRWCDLEDLRLALDGDRPMMMMKYIPVNDITYSFVEKCKLKLCIS